jgi:hypothetical protein
MLKISLKKNFFPKRKFFLKENRKYFENNQEYSIFKTWKFFNYLIIPDKGMCWRCPL